MYKCNKCGYEFVGDNTTEGLRVLCPNCRTECEPIKWDPSFVCEECGLSCSSTDGKCPACGGAVVAFVRNDEKTPIPISDDTVSSSLRENFFWGVVFPEPTLILGVGALFARSVF